MTAVHKSQILLQKKTIDFFQLLMMICSNPLEDMQKKTPFFLLLCYLCFPPILFAQHTHVHSSTAADLEPQPLLAQAIRLNEALSFLGSSLPSKDQNRL